MGGRGASSGISKAGKKYGSEYTTLLQSGNIKFVRYNDAKSAKVPMETMTKSRVYVTVNRNDELMSITYYDRDNRRKKQIDLLQKHKGMIPHTHHGYEHNEFDGKKGATKPNEKEKKMVENVKKLWFNRK